MNDFTQQKKLDILMDSLKKHIDIKSDAVMVVGTYAHSKNYAIKSTSDIDLIVISDIEGVMRTINSGLYAGNDINASKVLELYEKNQVDIISTRHAINNALFTIHFLKKESFKNKFATIVPSQLISFRFKPKDYMYTYLNFKGEGIEDKVVNERFEEGFLVFTKNCLIKDGSYFSGSPHNKLMSEPLIIFDREGIINNSISSLRSELVRRIIYEHGENYDSKMYSILNTLVRKNIISPEITDKLIKYENETRNIVSEKSE